jgi:hypothetical protein
MATFPSGCVSRIKLTRSAGGKSCRGNNQSPVTWIAGSRETGTLKPIDKDHLGWL